MELKSIMISMVLLSAAASALPGAEDAILPTDDIVPEISLRAVDGTAAESTTVLDAPELHAGSNDDLDVAKQVTEMIEDTLRKRMAPEVSRCSDRRKIAKVNVLDLKAGGNPRLDKSKNYKQTAEGPFLLVTAELVYDDGTKANINSKLRQRVHYDSKLLSSPVKMLELQAATVSNLCDSKNTRRASKKVRGTKSKATHEEMAETSSNWWWRPHHPHHPHYHHSPHAHHQWGMPHRHNPWGLPPGAAQGLPPLPHHPHNPHSPHHHKPHHHKPHHPHHHNPHKHNPHKHHPHRHNPHKHNPHQHVPLGLALSGNGDHAILGGVLAIRGLHQTKQLSQLQQITSISGGTWFTTIVTRDQRFYKDVILQKSARKALQTWYNRNGVTMGKKKVGGCIVPSMTFQVLFKGKSPVSYMDITRCMYSSVKKQVFARSNRWGRRLMDARYTSPLARVNTVTAMTLPPNAYQNAKHVKLHRRPAATFLQTDLFRHSKSKPLTRRNHRGAGKLLVPIAWAEPGADASKKRGWLYNADIKRFTTRPSSSGAKFKPMTVFRRPDKPSFFNPFRLPVLVVMGERTLKLPSRPLVWVTFAASGAAAGPLGLPYFIEGDALAKVANFAARLASLGTGGLANIVENLAIDTNGNTHHSDWDSGAYRLIDGVGTDNIGVPFSIAALQKNNKERKYRQIAVESAAQTSDKETDFEFYFNSGVYKNEIIPGNTGKMKLKQGQMQLMGMMYKMYNIPSPRIFKQRWSDVQWERVNLVENGKPLGRFDWWRGALDTVENRWYGVRAGSKVDVLFFKRQHEYAADLKVGIMIMSSKAKKLYTKVGALEERAMAPIFAAYKACLDKFGDMACMKNHLKRR
jgi:hypothetical protein